MPARAGRKWKGVIMNQIIEQFKKIGIIPVVVIDDAKDAVPLAKALVEGGLPCAEVTFRTAAAHNCEFVYADCTV